ncbi:hypothetical protein TWF694_004410 [Orbilia ellipsospora]|uniref:C2H2-type domain-containing protein n=1 Tax=Orbilia ellipsospora TaxID=2528407 RepID=A0AAV9WV04_9PEZI
MAPNSCTTCKTFFRPGLDGLSYSYHCCPCNKIFVGADCLNNHYRSHHGQNAPQLPSPTYTCVECQKDFWTEPAFLKHIDEHEILSKYIQTTSATGGVLFHPVTKRSVHICPDCGRDFRTKDLKKSHIRRCPALSRYRCLNEGCFRSFGKVSGMIDHLESGGCKGDVAFDRRLIARTICERDKRGLITVPGALKLLEGRPERPVTDLDLDQLDSETDPDPEATNPSLDGSSWGMMTPSSNATCESYEFLSNQLENLEIVSLHSDDSVITPSTDSFTFVPKPAHCPVNLSRKPNAQRKAVNQTQKTKATHPNQCHICQKLFKTKRSMQQHLASSAHTSNLPNKCGICKKVFKKQAYLKDHLASPVHNPYHVSESPNSNQCRICKKIFKKRPHLEQHLASPVHDPKIYHCKLSFLGLKTQAPVKKFKSLNGLVAHIETGACRGGNSTFDMAASMLGILGQELGFPGTVGITKRLGGKFRRLV